MIEIDRGALTFDCLRYFGGQKYSFACEVHPLGIYPVFRASFRSRLLRSLYSLYMEKFLINNVFSLNGFNVIPNAFMLYVIAEAVFCIFNFFLASRCHWFNILDAFKS